jgi:dolichol kinase
MSTVPMPLPSLDGGVGPDVAVPPVETPLAPAVWSSQLSSYDYSFMLGLPVASLVIVLLVLRVLWRPKGGPKFRLPKQVPTYGSIDLDADMQYQYDGDSNDLIYAGQIAGRYDTRWTRTFDFTFLVTMFVFATTLVVITSVYKPELWGNGRFWLSLVPKLAIMMGVSTLGGIICRLFCIVDESGYVLTERNSKFKVNYTRKFQLLAAYLIPLIVKPSPECDCDGALELAWGDFATLLAFLVLIKPVRERSTFFMLQFNSLDRPEDRPHTLKWLVAGNVFPSLFVLLFFRWLFSRTTQSDLVFILVLVASVGDGLAEPVGIAFGKHKYSTTSCLSKRKYTRSYEGSAVVFLSGMVFPAAQYYDFTSATQLLVTMLVLPFVAAYAEATAPHTMDAPVLMTATGAVLYIIIHAV